MTLQRIREALKRAIDGYASADEHIKSKLQPEFARLANGERLTWPEAWTDDAYNERVAAERLATWWHGVGCEEERQEAREALAALDGYVAVPEDVAARLALMLDGWMRVQSLFPAGWSAHALDELLRALGVDDTHDVARKLLGPQP